MGYKSTYIFKHVPKTFMKLWLWPDRDCFLPALDESSQQQSWTSPCHRPPSRWSHLKGIYKFLKGGLWLQGRVTWVWFAIPTYKRIKIYKGPGAATPRGVDESFDLGLPHIDSTRALEATQTKITLAKCKTKISGWGPNLSLLIRS